MDHFIEIYYDKKLLPILRLVVKPAAPSWTERTMLHNDNSFLCSAHTEEHEYNKKMQLTT